MKIVRASEIGVYQFCNRAWWYQQKGYESENKVELAGGIEIHEKHSHKVWKSTHLKLLAFIVLFMAIAIAVIWISQSY